MKQIIMMTKDGCGSCKEFKPKAKNIAEELGYEFRVLPNPEIEVPFFPYFYMMFEGKVVEQWGGVVERKFRNVLARNQKS